MSTAVLHPVTRELLEWIAGGRRSYAETMEAWTSNCPRHPAWDDAAGARWVAVRDDEVVLTEQGRALLEGGGE